MLRGTSADGGTGNEEERREPRSTRSTRTEKANHIKEELTQDSSDFGLQGHVTAVIGFCWVGSLARIFSKDAKTRFE